MITASLPWSAQGQLEKYLQLLVRKKEFDAHLITGAHLGNFVQYTGNLLFLPTTYLGAGEPYLLQDRLSGTKYCLGYQETEEENKECMMNTKTTSLTALASDAFQIMGGSQETLATTGVLHQSKQRVYNVTFPHHLVRARLEVVYKESRDKPTGMRVEILCTWALQGKDPLFKNLQQIMGT